jgi:ATP-dependent 26S proteasome regulatory subunit
LQEINEIRIKHPRILIIAATNFEHDIDPAIKRQGRLDYHIELHMPTAGQREKIIRETLKKANVLLSLSNEEIESLVEVTEGLPPLVLTRAIMSFVKVRGPRIGRNLDVQTLLEIYQHEKRCIAEGNERHKKKGLRVEG